jgi:hypothetical protein
MNSRRLQKTPELNWSGLQENMDLEGIRGSHTKAEPNQGPAQADRSCGEANRPLGPEPPHLLEASSTAS